MTDEDDALELVRSNEAILVLVEVLEGLAETFALQTLHHLREFAIYTEALEGRQQNECRSTYIQVRAFHSSCPSTT